MDDGGLPLAGIRVELKGQPRRNLAKPRSLAESSVTGADGRFAVRFESSGYRWVMFRLGGSNTVPLQGRWEGPAPGQVRDLGDVSCSTGCLVRGTVTDRSGAPIAEVPVSLRLQSGAGSTFRRDVVPEPESLFATTDAAGNFEFRGLVLFSSGAGGLDSHGAALKIVIGIRWKIIFVGDRRRRFRAGQVNARGIRFLAARLDVDRLGPA